MTPGNPKNRIALGDTASLQLSLGRWKKAFCPKIGKQ